MPMNGVPEQETVYLTHCDQALHHAQHYLGFTVNLPRRLAQHRNGTGAKLLRAVNRRGIAWDVVRIWLGGPALERALKSLKKSRELCPVCLQQRLCERWHVKPLRLHAARTGGRSFHDNDETLF
jgi:predicted GIY-YIG superfamily endonuclease